MKAFIMLIIPILFGISDEDIQNTQRHEKISNRKKLKIAKQLVKDGSYHNAVLYYEDVHEDRPNNSHIIAALADLNYYLRDYKEAQKWYEELAGLDPKNYPVAQFHLGRMLKINGKYAEAKVEFKEFIDKYDDDDAARYKSLAKAEAAGCDYAIEAMEEPTTATVVHLENVNHKLTDFSPQYVSPTRLMYAALPSDTAINLNLARKGKKDYYARIFVAGTDGQTWEVGKQFQGPQNKEKMHAGNAILSDNGRVMYFTLCGEENAYGMICNIYESVLRDGDWTEPKKLDNINKEGFTTTHPAVGKDAEGKDVMYFSSNRKGTRGGMDLWYSVKDVSGKWSRPSNAGKAINTAGDDMTPFYDMKNQKLYFASTGHVGIGGIDIYYTEGNIDQWGEVMNMGVPINTSYDDQYLALDDDGELGYIVSNRPGVLSPRGETCCDDIFYIDISEEKNLFIKGYFTSRKDPERKPIEGVEAALYFIEGKQFSYVDEVVTSKDKMFYFQLQPGGSYKMNGTKEGYWPSITNVETPTDLEESDTIFKIFYIEPVVQKKIKVQQVYFAFDKSVIRDEYIERMDSLHSVMVRNMKYLLEIAGHTDSKGTDSYNQKLSERRARSCADYMLNLGVDDDRLLVKGFGEERPIAPNENPDGSDNPIGRAKNRRVEFKLLKDAADTEEVEIIYDDSPPSTIE
ncbi:MAG: OmpA family protein [Chitinophagales bacterium]|nr:OmpA family protein [Chitinophagales bacterium]